MKKNGIIIIVACLLALIVVIGVGAAWYLGAFASEPLPLQCAPKDTDLIAYVNMKKISAHKVGAHLKKKEIIANGFAECKKQIGIAPEDLLESELFLFMDSRKIKDGMDKMSASYLVRFDKANDMPQKLITALIDADKKEAKEGKKGDNRNAKDTKVDGKPALIIAGTPPTVALIATSRRTMQVSVAPDDKNFHCLTKTGETDLTRTVDTGALFCFTMKLSDEQRNEIFKNAEKNIPRDLDFIILTLRERGNDLELELTGGYRKPESAKTARSMLQTMAKAAAAGSEDPELKKTLESISFADQDSKVVISLKKSSDEVIALIDKFLK